MDSEYSVYHFIYNVAGRQKSISHSFNLRINDGNNIIEHGFYNIRELEFDHIMSGYNGCLTDIENAIKFLREKGVIKSYMEKDLEFCYTLGQLKKIIFPIGVIEKNNILVFLGKKKCPDGCLGCHNTLLAQKEHMECPHGCLHNQTECSSCKERHLSPNKLSTSEKKRKLV